MRYTMEEFKLMKNRVENNFKPALPTEQEDQEKLIKYMDLKGCKYSAIPNSTYTKSWKQKTKNTKMGVRAGLPDLFIIAKNHAFFIEMKRIKRGVVSDNQMDWIDAINTTEIKAYICKGFEEAKQIIDKYCTLII